MCYSLCPKLTSSMYYEKDEDSYFLNYPHTKQRFNHTVVKKIKRNSVIDLGLAAKVL